MFQLRVLWDTKQFSNVAETLRMSPFSGDSMVLSAPQSGWLRHYSVHASIRLRR
jgi:hypothetical protein